MLYNDWYNWWMADISVSRQVIGSANHSEEFFR